MAEPRDKNLLVLPPYTVAVRFTHRDRRRCKVVEMRRYGNHESIKQMIQSRYPGARWITIGDE